MTYIHKKYLTENSVDLKTLSPDLQKKLTAFTEAESAISKMKDKKKQKKEREDMEITSKALMDEIDTEVGELEEAAQVTAAAEKKKKDDDAAAEKKKSDDDAQKKSDAEKKKSGNGLFGFIVAALGITAAVVLGIQTSKNAGAQKNN